MNWEQRYAASRLTRCIFCNGLNHWGRTAKDWTEENSEQTGLPRPSVATEPLAFPFGENAQNNWRKRTPIPWSTRPLHVDPKDEEPNADSLQLVTPESGLSLNSAPAPIPGREEMVRSHGLCAMCGEQFEPNDFVVRFNGFHGTVESDHYPMHQKCMRQTVAFCPHMKEYGNDFSQLQSGKSKFFSRGTFKDMLGKAVNQTQFRKNVKNQERLSNWNKRYASEKSLDPNEVIKAQNAGISLGSSARFNGATHNEIIQVHKSGVDLDDYASARRAGATHDEIMQAYKSEVDLDSYGDARRVGATHDEAMQAHKSGVDLGSYSSARNNGATHDEAMQAHKSGVDLYDYASVRESGATHDEAMQAHKSGVDLGSYASVRNNGATHNEIMQAHKSGVDLDSYGYARESGATHNEAMQAQNAGVNLYGYGSARYNGATHNEAIKNSLALGE